MAPHLALLGGEEFTDGFEDVHAGLLAECGGRRVVYLPTCAADDGAEAIDYWCATARTRLSALGAEVEAPRVVDAASANDAGNAQLVAEADWVYLGGGYPHVAMRILPKTRVLEALEAALARGALICGTSGGAMLMSTRSWVMTPELIAEVGRIWESGPPPDWDPPAPPPLACLDLVSHSVCWPHFNRTFSFSLSGSGWRPAGFTVIGIDEHTALVRPAGSSDRWEVRGHGMVTILRDEQAPARYGAGERVAP
jgi:cyanophycinase